LLQSGHKLLTEKGNKLKTIELEFNSLMKKKKIIIKFGKSIFLFSTSILGPFHRISRNMSC
jgi:hypothetical protein